MKPASSVEDISGYFDDELYDLCLARLHAEREPLVSVIVPVYNNWPVTRRCLASLLQIDFDITLQVIVVDDASTDETPAVLARLPGIDVLRNGTNQGFLLNCNRALALARGQFVWFLNNDTEVTQNSLRGLVRRLRSDPAIGIVGSKLVYPDGRLQEAGGIIWSDATGWNFGRFDRPDRPSYNFVRDVDYVSGASLLVRADLLHELGGFDPLFAPAYYEDVDLCFRAREQNYRVVFEPTSVVVHYEGVSSGTSTLTGVKRFQDVNRPKFREKWSRVLDADHLKPDASNVPTASRFRGRHELSVLVVDSYVPLYDQEAGSNRLWKLINRFVERGVGVMFFPDDRLARQPYTLQLERLGVEVVYPCDDEDDDVERAFLDALASVDVAWICRPHLFLKYVPLVHRHAAQIAVIYDTVDLHHVRLQRQAEREGTETASWQRMRTRELGCARAADATIVVSNEEAGILRTEGIEQVAVVPTIHDLEIAEPREVERTAGVLFIGGYNHAPNVDAVLWLVKEIMPIVWAKLPRVRLTLLGSNPPAAVRELASELVDVPGYINDVDPYFRAARVFVAPLRFGAGIKGKLGQALSYRLPIVTTPVGSEGFGFVHGISALIAEDTQAFANDLVTLYTDSGMWRRLSDASATVLAPFESQHVANNALSVMRNVAPWN